MTNGSQSLADRKSGLTYRDAVSLSFQSMESDAAHALHQQIRRAPLQTRWFHMDYGRNRHRGAEKSQKINFFLAQRRIVLINPHHDRSRWGFELNLKVTVPEPFGKRLYVDDAA
jgi:hypothetical protein